MPSAVILQLGHLQLRWYGFFAALAMLAGFVLISWRIRKEQGPIRQEDVPTLLITCVAFGLIGARLEFVRRFWGVYFADDPLAIFRVWEGGLVFQGGFVLAALAAIVLCKIRHWQIGKIADLLAPALPISHAIARLGCLFNGCCFGLPWKSFGAIQYPPTGNDVLHTQILLGQLPEEATETLPVFPIQALEALWCILIAGGILFCEKRGWLPRRRFFLYILGYSVGRFFLEFLRGDYHQNGGLTPAQWTTALVILPITAALFAWTTVKK